MPSWWKFIDRPFVQIGQTSLSLSTLMMLFLALVLIFFVHKGLRFFLKTQILKRLGIDQGNREAIATLVSYSLSTLLFIGLLQSIGIDLGAFAVVLGGLGVGVGFGLQNIVKDIISGLTLLFERKIKVGDFLEFDGSAGHVTSISLRSVLIRTLDGGDVVIPNSHLTDNRVLNWSLESLKARLHLPVAVAYGADPVLVTELLLKSADMEPHVCAEPRPQVISKGWRDDPNGALEFELLVWVDPIDKRLAIMGSLYFIIEHHLRAYGIAIPFCENWLRNLEVLSAKESLWEDPLALNDFHQAQVQVIPNKFIPVRDRLAQIPLFETFTALEMRQLIEVGRRRRLRASQVLFREGDPGDAFYIILEGSVSVIAEKINKTLATMEQGQFFGEVALLLGIPRTAMIQAQTDTIVFEVDRKGFSLLLKTHPDLTEAIVQALGEHKEELQERQQKLRELGLVDSDEDDNNVMDWARKRLARLFGLKPPTPSPLLQSLTENPKQADLTGS